MWGMVPAGVWGCIGLYRPALDRSKHEKWGRHMRLEGIVKWRASIFTPFDHPYDLHEPPPLLVFRSVKCRPTSPQTPPHTSRDLPPPKFYHFRAKKIFEKISIFQYLMITPQNRTKVSFFAARALHKKNSTASTTGATRLQNPPK